MKTNSLHPIHPGEILREVEPLAKSKISPSPEPSPQAVARNADAEAYKPEEFRDWLQTELRLAKAYWQQRIQPFIISRKLRAAEFEVAWDAYRRVEAALQNACNWNAGNWPLGEDRYNGDDGKKFPILNEEFWAPEGFNMPESLSVDTSLKPETLAVIAAPMIGKRAPKLSPPDAVRIAHDLLTAAKEYLDTLRKAQRRHGFTEHCFIGDNEVSFDEIEQSNKMDSGQLPLLPPDPMKRNEGQLKLAAIKAAVTRFYEKSYRGSPEKLAALQKIRPQINQIPLPDLCRLRWERFKRFWTQQQMKGQKRQATAHTSSEPEKSEAKVPTSAGSSPLTAGKSEPR